MDAARRALMEYSFTFLLHQGISKIQISGMPAGTAASYFIGAYYALQPTNIGGGREGVYQINTLSNTVMNYVYVSNQGWWWLAGTYGGVHMTRNESVTFLMTSGATDGRTSVNTYEVAGNGGHFNVMTTFIDRALTHGWAQSPQIHFPLGTYTVRGVFPQTGHITPALNHPFRYITFLFDL